MSQTIGERIKRLRTEKGFSRQRFADAVGVNRSTILRYENGEIEGIPVKTISKMADVLNVDPVYLALGYTDMIVYDEKTELQFVIEALVPADRSRLLEMAKLMFGDKYGWKKD